VTVSTEVNWQLDGITMYGTLTLPSNPPEGNGLFPGVVLVAGSGPTDRDWCSPLLPRPNGSGRLLAEALADAGFASLRYDKRASGPHVAENLPQLIGKISMRSHLDEVVAAVEVLAAQESVDPARIAGLGNSEGCLHVLHYASSQQRVPFARLVLTAPPGRAIGEVLLTQLRTQLGLFPGGSELMPLVEAAAARYSAGEPMDPDPALPEQVRMVLASFEVPANLPFARELWVEDAADSLARVATPTLVLIGGKDLQVDVQLDGEPLRAAAAGVPDVSFVFPTNANHVLKEELRSRDQAAAAPGSGYNDEGARLDPEALTAIVDWLRAG
jgi:alpha-beta hydrolase superfamily lysophospholipase